MQRAIGIPIDRDFLQALSDERSRTKRNFARLVHVSGRRIVAILSRDIECFLGEFRRCSQRDAGGIVETLPFVPPTQDKIRKENASDGAVRHPVSGIARDHVNVLISRIASNKPMLTSILQPNAMIRVGRIPVECLGHRAFRNPYADYEGAVGRLLGVDGNPVVHRGIDRACRA